MSNQLQSNLDEIYNQKKWALTPENLRAGVYCLGVSGTLQEGPVAYGSGHYSDIMTLIDDIRGVDMNLAKYISYNTIPRTEVSLPYSIKCTTPSLSNDVSEVTAFINDFLPNMPVDFTMFGSSISDEGGNSAFGSQIGISREGDTVRVYITDPDFNKEGAYCLLYVTAGEGEADFIKNAVGKWYSARYFYDEEMQPLENLDSMNFKNIYDDLYGIRNYHADTSTVEYAELFIQILEKAFNVTLTCPEEVL